MSDEKDRQLGSNEKAGPPRTKTGTRAVPVPFHFPPQLAAGPDILAVGGQTDNAVCVVRGPKAYLSVSNGDLRDAQSFDAFRSAIDRLEKLAKAKPVVVAHDLNPDCAAVRYARQLESVQLVPLQHEFAHVASCMAEHGETGRVLGVVYGRGGYGGDGTVWGAEFLSVTPAGYQRLGHLRQVRWPGGEHAVRNSWRIAMALIYLSYGYHTREIAHDLFKDIPKNRLDMVYEMLEKGYHFPFGSSMGAYFEAIGAIAGACPAENSNDRAAAVLESLLLQENSTAPVKAYPYEILDDGNLLLVDPTRSVYDIVENALADRPAHEIAARHIETVLAFTLDACRRLRLRVGTDKVVLTGSIFRQGRLRERTVEALEKESFDVLTHGSLPPDDSGVALGQAYAARALHSGGSEHLKRSGK